jgi:Putative Actinobacterial Holin-X, holin superfamily III
VPEPSDKSVPQVVSELWDLTKDYARQETVDPLKGIGRYLAFGLAGAVLTSIGVILLLLALLRALQTETGTALTGNLSWIPYLVVLLVGAVLILLATSRINPKGRKDDKL